MSHNWINKPLTYHQAQSPEPLRQGGHGQLKLHKPSDLHFRQDLPQRKQDAILARAVLEARVVCCRNLEGG